MVTYLYCWKLKEGREEQFTKAWSSVSQTLKKQCASFGARLHLGDDGMYYGYTQWPDTETRNKADFKSLEMEKARNEMLSSTLETFPPITLDPIADFLASP